MRVQPLIVDSNALVGLVVELVGSSFAGFDWTISIGDVTSTWFVGTSRVRKVIKVRNVKMVAPNNARRGIDFSRLLRRLLGILSRRLREKKSNIAIFFRPRSRSALSSKVRDAMLPETLVQLSV